VGSLTGKILMQQSAVATLIRLYGSMAAAAQSAAAAMPMAMGMGAATRGGVPSGFGGINAPAPNFKGYNKGVVPVPGSGNKDTIPALLTPGESVVTKDATQKYAPIIAAMNAGTLPGFIDGLSPQVRQPKVQVQSPYALVAGHLGGSSLVNVKEQMALVQSNHFCIF
jgi:hypothetical protein